MIGSLADQNNYIKMDIYYPEEDITVTSTNINTMDERVTAMGEDFELIPHQSIVDVVAYQEDGVVVISGQITLSTSSQLNFNIIKTDDKQERRNYLKVRTQIKTRLLKAYSMGRGHKPFVVDEAIVTRDVSLGGIGFYSNRVFFKKQQVNVDLSSIKPGFFANAEVLRKERGPYSNGYRFKYGCRFLPISGEEERVLCEYVFKTQLENHRKLMRLKEELDE